MGRNSLTVFAWIIAAVICSVFVFGCGGGGAPSVVEPPPEAPVEVPDQTLPVEHPGESPLPQGTSPYPGDGTDWLLATFNSASAGGGGEPDLDDKIPPASVLISGISEDYTAWGVVDLSLFGQDDRGVNLIALAIDGKGVELNNGSSLRYEWDTFAIEDGDHYLDILARDVGYNCVRCTVLVEVKNAVDNAPPVIDLHSITSWGYGFSGIVDFSARATDDKGITRAVVSVDGEEIFTTDSGDISFKFNTLEFVDGEYDLGITVHDAVGKSDEEIRHLGIGNNTPKCTLIGKVTNPTGVGSVPCNVRMSNWVHPDYVHDMRKGLEHLGDPDKGWNAEMDPTTGSFILRDVPVGRTQFKIDFGQFEMIVPVNLPQGGEYQIPHALTRIPAEGNETLDMRRIGVVTGVEEGLEHTLAKLGYGSVDGDGALVLGTETFTLIDGDNSLPDAGYMNFNAFITDPGLLDDFQTLFIASGNVYEQQFLTNEAVVGALRAWMENGGTLYCGGSSYDFLEHIFPWQIDFGGADEMDGRGDIPEPFDAAMIGEEMHTAEVRGRYGQNTSYPYSVWVDWADLSTGNEDERNAYIDLEQGRLELGTGYGLDLVIERDYPLQDGWLGCNVVTYFRENGRHNNYVSTVSSLIAPAQPSPVLTDIEKLIAARLQHSLFVRRSH